MEILAFLYFLLFHDWDKAMQESLKEHSGAKDEEGKYEDKPVDYRKHCDDVDGD